MFFPNIMPYVVGDTVWVRFPTGVMRAGVIKGISYWTDHVDVDFGDDRRTVTSAEIIEAAKVPDRLRCECGSDKLGHPGHSSWCNKFRKY